MRAAVSVHEPKQPEDEESPLAYSMEGLNSAQPGALLPYVWAPGWNSNQSLHRFQAEVGGPLKGGTAGVRLLQPGPGLTSVEDRPLPFQAQPGRWLLVPRQRIFGSDELSALSPGVAELVEAAFIEVCAADARMLGVSTGDGIVVNNASATLEVRINDAVVPGCAGFSIGLAGAENLLPLQQVSLHKAQEWQRRSPQLIGSDRGGHV